MADLRIVVTRLESCPPMSLAVKSAGGPPVDLHHKSQGEFVEIIYPQGTISSHSKYTVVEKRLYDACEYQVSVTEECLIDGPLMSPGISKTVYTYCVDEVGVHCISISESFDQNDPEITEYRDGPQLSTLHPGETWSSRSFVKKQGSSQYVLDIESTHIIDDTLYSIRFGTESIECVRQQTISIPHRGDTLLKQEPELLLEQYFDLRGKHILTRRYNGPIWRRWNKELHEKLIGNPFIDADGNRFFLWYDLLVTSSSNNLPNNAIQSDAFGAADL